MTERCTDRPKPDGIEAMADALDDTQGQAGTLPVAGQAMPDESAAVSLMITRRQRAALRDQGLSDAVIREMTPQQAHRLLRL